jgi:hypothetical protein
MGRLSNRQRLNNITSNIQTVKKALEQGEFPSGKAILSVVIAETIMEVREASFSYEASYSSNQCLMHLRNYKSRALKYKSMLISDLREVLQELEKRKGNVNRCVNILNKMLEMNLYTTYTENFIKKHVSLSHKYVPELITVK